MPADTPTPLPAPDRRLARAFRWYLARLARRQFTAVHWSGPPMAGAFDPARPVIFVANHTNWWDGFLACLTTGALGLDFQVLMEAAHLARYPFFRRVGAIPLRRTGAFARHADLMAARGAVRPGTGLWVFPQGARRPAAERPARFERGAAALALAHPTPVQVWPVAIRYAFVGEQRPEAFVGLGEPWTPARTDPTDRRALTSAMEGRLLETLDRLDDRLAREDLAGFIPLVRGAASINKRLDRVRHALGLLDGPFEERNG
jgi:1-acyl-sn-glycerol-3-phosphate acyltransferase